jgi:hypothetical protein
VIYWANDFLDFFVSNENVICRFLWQRYDYFSIFVFFVVDKVVELYRDKFLPLRWITSVHDSVPCRDKRAKAIRNAILCRLFISAQKLQESFISLGKIPENHVWVDNPSIVKVELQLLLLFLVLYLDPYWIISFQRVHCVQLDLRILISLSPIYIIRSLLLYVWDFID